MQLITNALLAPEPAALTDLEYRRMRDLVYHRFGLNLGEQKRALISGRLQKVLREKGFSSFQDYYDYVVNDPTGEALSTLINRLSTNHTFFYREKDHFEFFFQEVLPKMAAEQKASDHKTLRLWCPGCSSGEEPYTLAMFILNYLNHAASHWDIGILATDISARVLDIARKGVYSSESVARLSSGLVSQYFSKLSKDLWAVREMVKKLVLFRRLNLMRPNYPFRGKFQVIFCRNVMIYFDQPTRQALVERFYGLLEPEGYLFIGHSESLGRWNAHFRYLKPAVYQKMPR